MTDALSMNSMDEIHVITDIVHTAVLNVRRLLQSLLCRHAERAHNVDREHVDVVDRHVLVRIRRTDS